MKLKGEGSWRTRKDGRLEYALPIGKTKNGNTKRKFFYGQTKKAILAKVETWRKKNLLGYGDALAKTGLETYLTDWLKSNTHWAETTRGTNEDFVRIYIVGLLGTYRIGDLTPLILDGWQKALRARGLSPRVLELSYALLNQALSRATDLELIPRNPLLKVARPHVPKVKRLVWTPEQARRFREVIREDRLEALWLIALLVGYRRSELLGLRWQDIDWEGHMLHMRHTVTFVRGQRIAREGGKNRSSLRSLIVPREIIETLAHRRVDLELERRAARASWREHDLVFPSAVGTALPESTLREHLDALCTRAGVPRLTPHGLRRTYTSLTRLKGLDIKVISERLGHSSVVTTQDIYQQTYLEQHEGAALSSEELLGASAVAECGETAGDPSHQKPAVNLRSNTDGEAQKARDAIPKNRVSELGAEDGTRTHTPLQALAPETNGASFPQLWRFL